MSDDPNAQCSLCLEYGHELERGLCPRCQDELYNEPRLRDEDVDDESSFPWK